MALEIGQSAEFRAAVTDTRTPAALGQNDSVPLPPVFGTPFMIADMERACADLLIQALCDGEVSVGVTIDVRHLAPTPVGAEVISTATFTGQDSALSWFDVQSTDTTGKIGEGRIARAIVRPDTLLAKADART
ncbi:hypothetical protein [uncultured Roseobacter sp.]|uniref:thioesterase family protein n=1 Tax=uncultured Roseobacter sp. TaxID=114847 RepID=UPI002629B355|nr:hypothetical protein [uncultured Roseobacter sp.]